ncbi:MAG: DUF192 domain-containing protein [Planctomycetes bacterium]|nr:DUF192 domain-containing protein [Planctomycetota bacterium]
MRHSFTPWAAAGCWALVLAGCSRTLEAPGKSGDIVKLRVLGKTIYAEVASDEDSRSLGLMYRKSLPENRGMIFVYSKPSKLSFWMRNTEVPLSIAFLDDAGKILQIEDMRPKDEARTVSNHLVRYALEVNRGWFQRNGVGVGDSFEGFAEQMLRFRGES